MCSPKIHFDVKLSSHLLCLAVVQEGSPSKLCASLLWARYPVILVSIIVEIRKLSSYSKNNMPFF
jgi:hypothetical protein